MKKIILLILIVHCTLMIENCMCQWVRQNKFYYPGCVNDITHFNLQKVIAVGEYGQILLSTDSCTSIRNVNTTFNNNFKSLSFINEQTGYVCGSNGIILKTTNGGNNWTQLNTGGITKIFYGIQAFSNNLIVAVGEAGYIYKSTNGGANWSVKNSDATCYLLSVKFFNQNTGVAVGWPGAIYRTTNSGENWFRVYHGLNYTDQIMSVDIRNNTAYAVGDSTLIIRSTDYGSSWMKADTIPGGNRTPLYKIQILDSTTIVAVGDNMRISTNGGQNFSYYGAWGLYGSNLVTTKGLALKTIDTGYICGYKGIGKPLHYLSSLYMIDVPYNIYDLQDISVVDSEYCWVFGGGYFAHELPHIIYNTTNGGVNWAFKSVYNTIPDPYGGVQFFDRNTGYIIAKQGGAGYLLKTTDNGSNWNQVFYSDTIYFQYPLKIYKNRLYTMTSSGHIIWTTNDGQNWTHILPPANAYASHYYIVDSNTYYGCNSNGSNNLMKTTNTGQNWAFLYSPIYGVDWKEIHFINANTGFLVGNKSGIIKTTNGYYFTIEQSGITNSELVFNSVYMIDSLNVYVVGDIGVIYNTTNGGFSWNLQNSGVADDLTKVRFCNSKTGWIIGEGGVILHTTSAGAVWVSNNSQIAVNDFHLYQNYPNPFNPVTNIKYRITNSKLVILKIYDILGKEISTLVNGKQSSGVYEVSFDGSKLPSGIYFYKLEAGGLSEVKKMVLIK
jgi:photosystem II stability/assembly factor-like uncharacterized protein